MLLPDPQFSVEANAWAFCAASLTARLLIPGWAWLWLWPPDGEPSGPLARRLILTAQAALTGLLVSLVVVITLAAFGCYTETNEWMALAAATLTGLLAGEASGRFRLAGTLRALLPGAAALLVAFAVLMGLPRRGEWVLGGWDPGIYVCQGVSLSQGGSFHPDPDRFFAQLRVHELGLFTRPQHTYLEAHPVVPLDPARRSLEPFFFPGTPSLIAVLYRCGGLRAATRVNDFAGLLATLAFGAAALALFRRGAPAWFSVLALLAQPAWLFHTHFPTSEMLQLALLSGMALLLARRSLSLGAAVLFGILLFMAEVNRLSFLPFGMLLVFLLAANELEESTPRHTLARIIQVCALGGGTLFLFFTNLATIERLHQAIPPLFASSLVLVVLMLLFDSGAFPRSARALVFRLQKMALGLGLGLVVALLAVAACAPGWLPDSLSWSLRGAARFMGAGWIGLAALGALFILRTDSPMLHTWCLFLLGGWLASLLNPEIARLLPWAARRNLEYGVPLVALLASGLPGFLWGRGGAPALRRITAVAILAVPLAAHGRAAATAWSATEHDGLTEVLAGAAERTRPDDIIVADHFRWGTPLRFLFDRTVINGELYLDTRRFSRMQDALQVLARLAAKGHRIRFLVSTERGLDVFPVVPSPTRLDWESSEWQDREVVQSPRARAVEVKQKPRRLRLYTWELAAPITE
ncbi:MAG TPA: hypothetical protein P5567_06850 [Kiritimatiellia bacterium]|nr:hypothetical protein [Kiritimatiellia bacterium]HRZ12156.1 hypothetical protein [Kiritimatiellia bacterium]HSA18086.1 hypothetical protein [Kiritimatiellia bacterium]